MKDNIILTKIWKDTDFFEVKVTCQNELIGASINIYVSNNSLIDLCSQVDKFISLNQHVAVWQNGIIGEGALPVLLFKFLHKDKCGHVRIEVYMEIADGGDLDHHNCCFFVDTELEALIKFKKRIMRLNSDETGTSIVLNDNKDI